MFFKKKSERSACLEAKGDKLFSKGKFERAIKKYKKAIDLDPSRKGVYDKLVEARDALECDWDVKDFVESVDWVMKKQEQENPSIRGVHEKLSPEWEKARRIAINVLECDDEGKTLEIVEELVAMGGVGTRAAISILLDFKKAATKDARPEEKND
jgi:tetratricopeptide (TPR) repeat protein